MSGNKNLLGKALFAGLFLLIIWICSLLFSCTTIRNAERRHDRIVKSFPSVHEKDTVTIEKIIEVETPPKIIQGETIFEKCPEIGESFTKVDTLKDGTTIETTLTGNEDGTKSLKTNVNVPKQKIAVKIKEKHIKIYVNRPLKWYQKNWGILVVFALAFLFGYFLRNLDKNKEQ